MKKFFVIFAFIGFVLSAEINLDVDCKGVLFGTKVHASNRNLFVGCVHEKGTIFACNSEEEIFDAYLGSCVTSDALPEIEYAELCENVAFGLFSYGDENCDRYIACEASRPYLRECPESSIFDSELQSCVFGESCSSLKDKKTTTKKLKTTTTKKLKTTKTSRKTTTESVTEDASTTRSYTAPSVPTIPSIPTYPSHRTTTESVTEDASTTRSYTAPSVPTIPSIPTYPPTTQTPGTTTRNPSDINVSFKCPLSGYGNIPSAVDCTKYYECIRGIGNPRSCPQNQVFDVITSECGNPQTSLCADRIRCV